MRDRAVDEDLVSLSAPSWPQARAPSRVEDRDRPVPAEAMTLSGFLGGQLRSRRARAAPRAACWSAARAVGVELAIDPPHADRAAEATARRRRRQPGPRRAPATYQMVRRARRERRAHGSSSRGQLIALAAPRPDQRLAPGRIELPAQPLHVDIDHVRDRVVVLVPDVLGDVAAADDVARVAGQVLEQRVFLRAQQDLPIADRPRAGCGCRW